MTGEPLNGVRVLDFTTIISGPYATCLLGDFGADVIAVEHPQQPNPVRAWNPRHDAGSTWWTSVGRNKRCITLDLSTSAGQELALELAADADVVFENFRPGTMERWGLDYEEFQSVNNGLVMVRISGYGQTGPFAEKPGFGTVAEAFSGWAHINGFPDREPLLPPIPLADMIAAQFATFSTMFALYERDAKGSGKGQVIDVSLYEPLFRLFAGSPEAYDLLGHIDRRTGNRSDNTAPRNLYETSDGYIALSASAQRIFENVAEAIDRPDLITDPRFETNEARVQHVDELDAIIENWTESRTTTTVIETMEAADAIVGPVYDISDAFDDQQYHARKTITEIEDEELGSVATHGVIPRLSRTPGSVTHLGPAHGEHNDEIYLDLLGLDPGEYDRLADDGVV